MSELDRLLRAAADADPGTRIEYRDRIAAFGLAAIERLEPWLRDARLSAFAVVTIARAASTPGAIASARSVLARNRRAATAALIDDALARLGSPRGAPPDGRRERAPHVPHRTTPWVVPEEVRALVEAWLAAGRPPQPAEPWNRPAWRAWHPAHASLFDALPAELDRDSVRRFARNAAADEEGATRALLASLAWGYAHANYGPSRARTMLDTPRSGARILRVARALSDEGAEAAYGLLAAGRPCHLDELGVSYATKFLYFAQPDGLELEALIHDDLVSSWLRHHLDISLPCNRWSVRIYGDYLQRLRSWAGPLDCTPGDVEYCIFQAEATERHNPWARPLGEQVTGRRTKPGR